MMGTISYQPVSQPQGKLISLLKFAYKIIQLYGFHILALPVEKPLFTQTLQPPMPQQSTVCTPSELITTTIPQSDKTVNNYRMIVGRQNSTVPYYSNSMSLVSMDGYYIDVSIREINFSSFLYNWFIYNCFFNHLIIGN